MTAVINRPPGAPPHLWSAMPGWGIIADLTPPELIAGRRLRLLRKLIGAGLLVIMVLCIGGYALAWVKHSSAASALDRANARTQQLTAEQGKYTDVTQIKASTAGISAQIASLMTGDVDVAILVAHIRDATPATAALTSVSVTLSAATHGSTSTTASLDRSGHPQIGSVTIAGSGRSLLDISTFVARLATLPGVSNVIPTTNSVSAAGATTFTVSLAVTDQLYTHRYDVAKPAGK